METKKGNSMDLLDQWDKFALPEGGQKLRNPTQLLLLVVFLAFK